MKTTRMMINRTAIALCMILFASFMNAQVSEQSQWTRYEISGIGSIMLPNTLEIRTNDLIKNAISEMNGANYVKPTFTAQNRGLNNLGKEASAKYARIIFKVKQGSASGRGDYPIDMFSEKIMTKSALQMANSVKRKQIEEQYSKVGVGITKWNDVSLERIGGVSSLKTSFERTGNGGDMVIVEYSIPRGSCIIIVTLTYRKSESQYWEKDFRDIVKFIDFQIDNKAISNLETFSKNGVSFSYDENWSVRGGDIDENESFVVCKMKSNSNYLISFKIYNIHIPYEELFRMVKEVYGRDATVLVSYGPVKESTFNSYKCKSIDVYMKAKGAATNMPNACMVSFFHANGRGS